MRAGPVLFSVFTTSSDWEKFMRNPLGALAFVLMLALVFGATPTSAQELFVDPQFDVEATPDIQYGTGLIGSPPSDFALLLDLYEPAGAGVPSPRPVVITIHGGGFTVGSRKIPPVIRIATEMASRGYVAISIAYRLIPQNPAIDPDFQPIGPANVAVQDLVTAHGWLLDNAEDLDADTSRIVVFGTSAGAITIVHAAYQLDDIGLPPLSGISSIVDLWGGFIGPPASTLVEPGEPPVFMVHGSEDTTIPARLSYELADAAEDVGIRHELNIVEGAGHGFEATGYFTREVSPGVTLFDRTVAFVAIAPEPVIPVEIDIKPGSDLNPINPMSRGVIPVALLGSDTFEVLDVDVTTLSFGPAAARSVLPLTNPWVFHFFSHFDVNRDGHKDLHVLFRTEETGIALGDEVACLNGETLNGTPFQGCDPITTVPNGCGLGFELILLLPPIMWLHSCRRRGGTP